MDRRRPSRRIPARKLPREFAEEDGECIESGLRKIMKEGRRVRVYLGGMSNHHDNNWKKLFQGIAGCDFYGWEIDSDQTSADRYFPDDLKGIQDADILVA